MSLLPLIIIFVGLIVALIISILKNRVSGTKAILFGINLTLFGGIIAVDQNSNLGGIEYLIAFLGLIISVIGLLKND